MKGATFMARRLIRMTISEYLDRYYMRVSHNAWYDSDRFITEIIERQKIRNSLFLLVLSDQDRVTVDGNCQIDVELY